MRPESDSAQVGRLPQLRHATPRLYHTSTHAGRYSCRRMCLMIILMSFAHTGSTLYAVCTIWVGTPPMCIRDNAIIQSLSASGPWPSWRLITRHTQCTPSLSRRSDACAWWVPFRWQSIWLLKAQHPDPTIVNVERETLDLAGTSSSSRGSRQPPLIADIAF